MLKSSYQFQTLLDASCNSSSTNLKAKQIYIHYQKELSSNIFFTDFLYFHSLDFLSGLLILWTIRKHFNPHPLLIFLGGGVIADILGVECNKCT